MGDICELILEQHHEMRRRFAELDDHLATAQPDEQVLARSWEALHRLLEAHAEAEELLFYPLLLRSVDDAETADETRDAISDHNKIRDAGAATAGYAPATAQWWSVVLQAREHNSTHMAEEERGVLRTARTSTDPKTRVEAGSKWEAFMAGRLGELAAESHDKDPETYVAVQTGSDA